MRREDKSERPHLAVTLLDARNLPVTLSAEAAWEQREPPGYALSWQSMPAVERAIASYTRLLRDAMRRTKGLRSKRQILAALEKKSVLPRSDEAAKFGSPRVRGSFPPSFRDRVADILVTRRKSFPRMRAESIALCLAYGLAVHPSTAKNLQRRQADRLKKRRRRGNILLL